MAALTIDCNASIEPPAPFVPPTVTEADGFRAAATEGTAKLSAGPILGDITAASVAVWIRADRAAPWHVTVWPDKQAKKKRVLDGPAPIQEHDFTATLRVTELTPSTKYNYQVELGEGKAAVKLPAKTFHTSAALGTAGKLRIAFGSAIGSDGELGIFTQINDVKPDLLMLIGDQIYGDALKANFGAYANKYEHNWGITQLNELMQWVPTYVMWDDHDIKDKYYANSSTKRYVPARLAYDLYAQSFNPPPLQENELHYQFFVGDVSFFVLDVRSHRANPKLEDGPLKTMLGQTQKDDLARFLKCGPGKIKVIVTPVMFSKYAGGGDSWSTYKAERDQLIAFLEHEKVDNVIMLSGDQHWTAVVRHDHKKTRFYEFEATPLTKGVGKASTDDTKDILARDDDNNVFGVVDIDTTVTPATIAFTACASGKPCKPGEEKAPTTGLDVQGDQENVPFTIKITEEDIGPKEKTEEPKPKK